MNDSVLCFELHSISKIGCNGWMDETVHANIIMGTIFERIDILWVQMLVIECQ